MESFKELGGEFCIEIMKTMEIKKYFLQIYSMQFLVEVSLVGFFVPHDNYFTVTASKYRKCLIVHSSEIQMRQA